MHDRGHGRPGTDLQAPALEPRHPLGQPIRRYHARHRGDGDQVAWAQRGGGPAAAGPADGCAIAADLRLRRPAESSRLTTSLDEIGAAPAATNAAYISAGTS